MSNTYVNKTTIRRVYYKQNIILKWRRINSGKQVDVIYVLYSREVWWGRKFSKFGESPVIL